MAPVRSMLDIHETRRSFRFEASDALALAALAQRIGTHLPALVWHGLERAHRGLQRQYAPGEVTAQARFLERWLLDFLEGPHDEAWALQQRRLGLRDAPHPVSPALLITFLGGIPSDLCTLAHRHRDDSAACEAVLKLTAMTLALVTGEFSPGAEDRLRPLEHGALPALPGLGAMSEKVAHELRNPLAGISGALQVIARSFPEDDPRRAVMGQIDAQVDRLDAVVADLLAFSQPCIPQMAPTRLSEVSGSVIHTLAAQQPGLLFRVDGDAVVWTDPSLLGQVLRHILNNAAQATNGNGTIELALEAGAITVRDSGPGIPLDLRERVFEPFFTTRIRGTGLGLSICRRVIRAMGGDIEIIADAVGTALRVSLTPRRAAASGVGG